MTYLNAASAALMYKPAADEIIRWQADLAENGTLNFDELAEVRVHNDIHAAAASMLRARPSDIAVGSSATELLSSLAWAMIPEEGQNIVSTAAAHPTTIYPWQRVARHAGAETRLAEMDQHGFVEPGKLLDLVDGGTAVLVISHVEYRTGQMYSLPELAETVHRHGGSLVVDATQSAGQVPIDVEATGVDALVSSAYKWLCGPFGAAVMYLSPALGADLDPGQVGWRSHEEMWDFRADRLEYPQGARRFEASTMAYGCSLGLARSVEYLNQLGVERILAHNTALTQLLCEEIRVRGGQILGTDDPGASSAIMSFELPGRDAAQIAEGLGRQGVVLSERGGALRVSPHVYNDEGDIRRMLEEMDRLTG
jgi:selenocysteine lyase/cysteine desulfurase